VRGGESEPVFGPQKELHLGEGYGELKEHIGRVWGGLTGRTEHAGIEQEAVGECLMQWERLAHREAVSLFGRKDEAGKEFKVVRSTLGAA
jgi:hypothetical protein